MKILFWSELFWPHLGGIEIFGQQLMKSLRIRGFRFAVVTSKINGTPSEEEYNGVHIYRLPLREGLAGNIVAFRQSLQEISRIKNSFRPDLHHINTAGPSFYYHLKTLNAELSSTLFTLHFFAPDFPKPNGALEQMLRESEWINCVSGASLEHTKRIFPFIENNSSVIYNALKVPSLLPTSLAISSTIIFAWGRLHSDKGFDLALKAFARIVPDFPHIRFQLAGGGEERQNLESLTKSLHIETNVDFLGILPEKELFKRIQKARLVVVPSRGMECFGLVALEAMQMARPVLGCRSGGMVEVIEHGKTGWVVDQENVEALEKGMRYFLTNPNEAQRMGEAGLLRAKTHFSLERMADQYESLYRKLGRMGRKDPFQGPEFIEKQMQKL